MMAEIRCRRATHADLTDIVALLADDPLGRGRENPSIPLDGRYTAAFEALDRDPNQLMAVVEDNGAIVGCLQLSFIPGLSRTGMLRGQIESVRIAASHRGEGLGRKVFDWAIGECRKRGCGLVQLTSDKTRPDAIQFYESLGFRASHEGLKLEL
jgi:ribosomal protein S18 acetylase RimI-like enzyme